jgi:hypothetical protein
METHIPAPDGLNVSKLNDCLDNRCRKNVEEAQEGNKQGRTRWQAVERRAQSEHIKRRTRQTPAQENVSISEGQTEQLNR